MSYSTLPADVQDVAEAVLTQKQLDAFKLWMNGYGTARIAIIVGVSEPRARALKDRALQKLKLYMEERP